MSQLTLIGDKESILSLQEGKLTDFQKSEFHPIGEVLDSDSQDEDEEQCDPPVIHMLSIRDTIKSICLKYLVTVRLKYNTSLY